MMRRGTHTKPTLPFPKLHRSITGTTDKMVWAGGGLGGGEAFYGGNGVIVPAQGTNAFVGSEIPDFDGEVGGTGG